MIKQKICIIGNGLTGLTAALILGRLNLEVHLIATPEGEKRKDVRTTAISDSNYKSLIDLIGKKYSKIFFSITFTCFLTVFSVKSFLIIKLDILLII